MNLTVLPKEFFLENEVTQISKELLGKIMVSQIGESITAGRIVETEAYDGNKDKACHAYLNRNTKRTEVMFKEGGRSYVYLCYGIHHLFNIVTHIENQANAVLIRALEPLKGIEEMKIRRGMENIKTLCNGPGKLAMAMGIHKQYNDTVLYNKESPIWIGKLESEPKFEIVETTRIGVDYAEEDAALPWRYYIKDNLFISKK
ncbi:DNA-3-methyladenine glycosylase [Litoribacter ruber]|uniref:Putative 3-methyladenine DNA glycosylase n=1 Tax=Litoribacter ruber TaxID=702568 RepID=A0AAP2CJX1_9BACT|nr:MULTISPECIES: DNA-3-methyladenine glycosylase [Litoribacter]MBS9524576.1 DNA-3-methyladenine glycosylase [Litoribacter alkaliphilus]MBT0810264.1 DNA-3-methyladenine glycosylase [Litoribacter ruber]